MNISIIEYLYQKYTKEFFEYNMSEYDMEVFLGL